MYTIIPLAGPDFYKPEYGTKPLTPVDGVPLLVKAYTSRSWNHANPTGKNVIFVLCETAKEQLTHFRTFLKETFPDSNTVTISTFTQGALLSALAGSSLIKDYAAPIAIDLIDLLYESSLDPIATFQNDISLQGIIPWFPSDYSGYSYLHVEQNRVTKTAEKKVISGKASAGTYFFRNLSVFLKATAESIIHKDEVAFKDLLFVCPAFSFLNGQVLPVEVFNVISISKEFKENY